MATAVWEKGIKLAPYSTMKRRGLPAVLTFKNSWPKLVTPRVNAILLISISSLSNLEIFCLSTCGTPSQGAPTTVLILRSLPTNYKQRIAYSNSTSKRFSVFNVELTVSLYQVIQSQKSTENRTFSLSLLIIWQELVFYYFCKNLHFWWWLCQRIQHDIVLLLKLLKHHSNQREVRTENGSGPNFFFIIPPPITCRHQS